MKSAAFLYIVCLFLLSACSGSGGPAAHPAQNDQLNAISPSGKTSKEKGFLQQKYDEWEEKDWEPNTREEVRQTDAAPETPMEPEAVVAAEKTAETNSSTTFTLQHYFDKWGRYLDEKEKQQNGPTHSDDMKSMPVIGD